MEKSMRSRQFPGKKQRKTGRKLDSFLCVPIIPESEPRKTGRDQASVGAFSISAVTAEIYFSR